MRKGGLFLCEVFRLVPCKEKSVLVFACATSKDASMWQSQLRQLGFD